MAHQMESTVRSHWCDAGTNSRNTADSTGRFPPTPRFHVAMSEQSAMGVGAPPAAIMNMPAMRRVRLNDILRRPC